MRISAILKGPRRMRRVAHIARKAASHGLGFLISRMDLQRHLPAWLRLPRRAQDVPPEDPERGIIIMSIKLRTRNETVGDTFTMTITLSVVTTEESAGGS